MAPDALPERPAADRVEKEALDRISLDGIQGLLDALSPNQAEVIALRFLAGFTLEETGQVLGRRVGAVKALQHRGLAALRRRIEAEAVSPDADAAITDMI